MPRDPERIDRILALIGETWKRHPQLRLCQLLCAAKLAWISSRPTDGGEVLGNLYFDPFYVEDDKLEALLRAFDARHRVDGP